MCKLTWYWRHFKLLTNIISFVRFSTYLIHWCLIGILSCVLGAACKFLGNLITWQSFIRIFRCHFYPVLWFTHKTMIYWDIVRVQTALLEQCRAGGPAIGWGSCHTPIIDQAPENSWAKIPTCIEGFHKSAPECISYAGWLNHGLSIIQLK